MNTKSDWPARLGADVESGEEVIAAVTNRLTRSEYRGEGQSERGMRHRAARRTARRVVPIVLRYLDSNRPNSIWLPDRRFLAREATDQVEEAIGPIIYWIFWRHIVPFIVRLIVDWYFSDDGRRYRHRL